MGMNLDPTIRATFWNVVFGNLFIWTSFIGTGQPNMQRFLAVPTFNDSKKILVIFVVFTVIIKSIGCFSGLIIYAKYADCDPLTAGLIEKPDQILPYYVLDVAARFPGISGLFVAGLFSTTLSTLSTILNSLSANLYEDYIVPFMPLDTSERKASTIMKVLTLTVGLLSVSLVFVVEKLGTVFQLILSITGVAGGPVFGAFTMGMLFPTANTKGAIFGLIGSIMFMSMVVIKNLYHIWKGTIKRIPKPLYTYGCNITSITPTFINESTVWSTTSDYSTSSGEADFSPGEPFWLFRMSFYCYIMVGTMVCLTIGLITSWATKNNNDPPVDLNLLSPCVHRFLRSTGATRSATPETIVTKINGRVDVKPCESVLDKLLEK